METRQVSRRRFLKTTGGLIVSFNLLPSMSRLLAAGCVTIAVPGLVPIEDRPGLQIVGSLAELSLETLRGLVAAERPASLGVLFDERAAG